jgi:hypothetical protein
MPCCCTPNVAGMCDKSKYLEAFIEHHLQYQRQNEPAGVGEVGRPVVEGALSSAAGHVVH